MLNLYLESFIVAFMIIISVKSLHMLIYTIRLKSDALQIRVMGT
jgi:hypothetical protein